MVSVNKIMSEDVVSISKNKTISDAAKLMTENHIGCLIVRGEYGEYLPLKKLGILTERDVLKKVVAENLKPRKTRIQEVMSRPIITVETKTPIHEVSKIMDENNIRRVAVVKDNTVVGIVTARDIYRRYRVRSIHGHKYKKSAKQI